jgi:hypothetical protein
MLIMERPEYPGERVGSDPEVRAVVSATLESTLLEAGHWKDEIDDGGDRDDGDGDRLRHLKLALTREHDRACGPSPKYPACLPASLPSIAQVGVSMKYQERFLLLAPSHARRTHEPGSSERAGARRSLLP